MNKLKDHLDITFHTELKLHAMLISEIPIDRRYALIKSLERMRSMWKLREQYVSTK